MIHAVRDMTTEQRQAVESLLGRAVSDDEAFSLKPVWTPSAGVPPSTPEERREAVAWLDQHFSTIIARQRPYSEEEIEDALSEALQAVRSESRPAN